VVSTLFVPKTAARSLEGRETLPYLEKERVRANVGHPEGDKDGGSTLGFLVTRDDRFLQKADPVLAQGEFPPIDFGHSQTPGRSGAKAEFLILGVAVNGPGLPDKPPTASAETLG